MLSKIRKKWNSYVGYNIVRMYRTFPFTTSNPHEKEWRREHFKEMWQIEWKLFKLSRPFDVFYANDKMKRRRRYASRMFWRMHHPTSGTRQLADWRRRGPHNPPPAVRQAIGSFRNASVRARQIQKEREQKGQ